MTGGPLELTQTIDALTACGFEHRLKVPGKTIAPPVPPSSFGLGAVEALRALGADLGDRIKVHETIGAGGMGVVHLATQSTLGRQVAVKTLRAGKGDAEATLRILREAWVTGALEHPNVVPVYDVGVDEAGEPLIVMKRIEGRSWAELLRDPDEVARRFHGMDPVEWHLRTLASVANAAHFAHCRGILHRDLKPENVMIGEFGEVYVLDWGIAISLQDDPSGRFPALALATAIAGTPHYMAPEMLRGDPSLYSPRTDVYLLGAIFYEIFTGEPPHAGENLAAFVADILVAPRRFPADFPAEARGICEKALARDPEERYATADALRVAIEEYLRHRGSRRLAHDAGLSLFRLERTLTDEPASDERQLRVANLLGECRFGYHAALAAWEGNVAARRDLDRALLLVIEEELVVGGTGVAMTLLREVSEKPRETVLRVEAAAKSRTAEDDRLRKLGDDVDPSVGTRTRTLLGGIFGTLWTIMPLGAGLLESRDVTALYLEGVILPSIVFLVLGAIAFVWARESMTRTAINRRFGQSYMVYMVAQLVLGAGAWTSRMSWEQVHLVFLFAWAITYGLLAVWAERWFFVPAVASALFFVVAGAYPAAVHICMSIANLLFTIVAVRVWLPKQDLERIHDQRRLLRQRAKDWLTRDRPSTS